MRVYLAARFTRQVEIAGYARELKALDIEVTSGWLTPGENDNKLSRDMAKRDIGDIKAADLLVEFTAQDAPFRGGHIFEAGYAYGQGIPVMAVGPKENAFHELNDILVLDTWEEAKKYLVWLLKQPIKD